LAAPPGLAAPMIAILPNAARLPGATRTRRPPARRAVKSAHAAAPQPGFVNDPRFTTVRAA